MIPQIMIHIWTTVAMLTRAPTSQEEEDGEAEVVDAAVVVAVEEIRTECFLNMIHIAVRRRHNTVGKILALIDFLCWKQWNSR